MERRKREGRGMGEADRAIEGQCTYYRPVSILSGLLAVNRNYFILSRKCINTGTWVLKKSLKELEEQGPCSIPEMALRMRLLNPSTGEASGGEEWRLALKLLTSRTQSPRCDPGIRKLLLLTLPQQLSVSMWRDSGLLLQKTSTYHDRAGRQQAKHQKTASASLLLLTSTCVLGVQIIDKSKLRTTIQGARKSGKSGFWVSSLCNIGKHIKRRWNVGQPYPLQVYVYYIFHFSLVISRLKGLWTRSFRLFHFINQQGHKGEQRTFYIVNNDITNYYLPSPSFHKKISI